MRKEFLIKTYKQLLFISTILFTIFGIINDIQTSYPITFPWFFMTIVTLLIGVFIVPIYLFILFFIDFFCFSKITNIYLRKALNTCLIALMVFFAIYLDNYQLSGIWIWSFAIIFNVLLWFGDPFKNIA
jgi:hypothetical protein